MLNFLRQSKLQPRKNNVKSITSNRYQCTIHRPASILPNIVVFPKLVYSTLIVQLIMPCSHSGLITNRAAFSFLYPLVRTIRISEATVIYFRCSAVVSFSILFTTSIQEINYLKLGHKRLTSDLIADRRYAGNTRAVKMKQIFQ